MPRLPAQQWSRRPRQPKTISSKGKSHLLYRHRGIRSLEGFSGRVTPKGAWPHHARSGGANYPRGEQKSNQFPICLPGNSVHQFAQVQECSGLFLPHFVGADTSIPSPHPFAEGFPHVEEQPASAAPHTPGPGWSPRPKR